MNKVYYLVSIALLLSVFSCTSKSPLVVPDGSYIRAVKDANVITVDGKMYDLEIGKDDKVYFLIRHAEKDTIPKENPRLTEEGLQRANYLADMMKGTRVDAVYSTMYTRTLFTIDTLAARKGLKIRPYEPMKLKQVYESIEADSSLNRVVIAGHSNTTPALANIILAKQFFTEGFDESDYDNFLIVVEKSNKDNMVYQLKYKCQIQKVPSQ